MAAGTWWATELNPQGLSQGDILSPFPIGPPQYPPVFLGHEPWQRPGKSDQYWPERKEIELFKKDPSGLFIARGRLTYSVVISHSCELDDKPDADRVLVAPIAPIDRISDLAARVRIMNQKRRALLPLPSIPNIGDHYADLRAITSVDKRFVSDVTRCASMSNDGLLRLQVQLIEYFSRIAAPELAYLIEQNIAKHQ